MRITFVNRLAGILWGGGESFDVEIARALTQLGSYHVKFVIGRRWSRLDIPMTEFPATYVQTPYLRWLTYRAYANDSRLLRKLGDIASSLDLDMFERTVFKKIVEEGIAEHTDVFQINGLPRLGAWLRQRLGVASVIVWHGPPGPEVQRWNKLCSATLTYGDSVAAVRENADSRAVEISIGVDPVLFKRVPADGLRKHYGIPMDAILFLFVGRMVPIKNLSFLIDSFASAFQHNPFLYLLLVGDGPCRPKLSQRINEYGLTGHVIFAGTQSGENLVAHYGAADTFVITSTYDNSPFVVREAMACELPVIATRVGGLPKLVEEGRTGLLVESGNVEQLTSALLTIAKDKDRRWEMGRCGRENVVRNHSWLQTAKQMVSLYQQL